MITKTHRLATAVIVAVTALMIGAPVASAESVSSPGQPETAVSRGPVADLGW